MSYYSPGTPQEDILGHVLAVQAQHGMSRAGLIAAMAEVLSDLASGHETSVDALKYAISKTMDVPDETRLRWALNDEAL